MLILKKLMVATTALTLSFAVHTANFFFYTGDVINNSQGKTHTDTVAGINDNTLEYLFPFVEENSSYPFDSEESSLPSDSSNVIFSNVPNNMTYSADEFETYADTYLFETDDAGADYLDKIVFCGDSLTYSMGLDKRFLGNYDVVAYGGLNVYDYLDYTSRPCYNQSDDIKSPIQWLSELQPEIVYLMLGTNGISIWDNSFHISKYGALLDRMQEALPNTKFVLVAIPAYASFRNTESFNGTKVDNYNMMLLEMAYERGMYYLNFGDITRDANGNFRTDLCSDDGIHWLTSCKELFVNYVRTHSIYQ